MKCTRFGRHAAVRAGLAALFILSGSPLALAQGPIVRVSVKRVLSQSGNPDPFWTESRIKDWMRDANSLFEPQLGIQLLLCEIADVRDPGAGTSASWFTVDMSNMTAMEAAAKGNPARHGWRSNAVNVYLVREIIGAGGVCSFPNGSHNEIIFVKPNIANSSVGLTHELGHYFGLYHTHETAFGVETTGTCQAQAPNCLTAGDLVCDTPADPFDLPTIQRLYGSGSCFGANSPQFRSLRYNVMSYYDPIRVSEALFTPGQRARAWANLNLHRRHVVEPDTNNYWANLGNGLRGAFGVPYLRASDPRTGGKLHMDLRSAAPNSLAYLVIGLRSYNLPAVGGTLVPFPNFVAALSTDRWGEAGLSLPLSPAFAGLDLYLQALVLDPGATQGVAFSRGVRAKAYRQVDADFNGDGYSDMVMAAPGEGIGRQGGAGAINVLYGSGPGLSGTGSQLWYQNLLGGVSEGGDQFGSAVAEGDFDGDGYDDVAIGVPLEDVGSVADAGAIHVMYGGSGGLATAGNQLWTQANAGGSVVEAGDKFGSALAVGDFDGDGYEDVAIGVPGEAIGSIAEAGAVQIMYGGSAGITSARTQVWHQDSAGIQGVAEAFDHFGEELAVGDFDGDGFDDLAIGAPGENIGTALDTGSINVIYGSASGLSARDQLWSQATPGLTGTAESDDHFGSVLATGDINGDGFADLAIGVPDENVGTVRDAGVVQIIYGSDTGLALPGNHYWGQSAPGLSGVAEDGDRFGAALVCADFDGDGYDDVAVGVPDEDIGLLLDAGMIAVMVGGPCGLSGGNAFAWHQDSPGILDTAEQADRFGAALAAGDLNGDGLADLMIGVPSEWLGTSLNGAGAVQVLYGIAGSAGLSASGNQFWTQDSAGVPGVAEPGDRAGAALQR